MTEKRTANLERRRSLATSEGTRHRWPTYLVSAAHGVSLDTADGHIKVPYGYWHARRIGSLQSACGRSAVTWQYFWTLSFYEAGSQACPECVRAMLAADDRVPSATS